jgi:transcriptional regulator
VRFGVLVVCGEGPLAAHIPFVLHREEGEHGTLCAHVAAADPLARLLDGEHEGLAIFGGPHAYVSPTWCPRGDLPTYNYLAVHAYGRPRAIAERAAVLAHLTELTAVHERALSAPWTPADAPDGRVQGLLEHIVAFTLPIDALQGKRKLAQNRGVESRAGIVTGLRRRGGEDDLAIAREMEEHAFHSTEAWGVQSQPAGAAEDLPAAENLPGSM